MTMIIVLWMAASIRIKAIFREPNKIHVNDMSAMKVPNGMRPRREAEHPVEDRASEQGKTVKGACSRNGLTCLIG